VDQQGPSARCRSAARRGPRRLTLPTMIARVAVGMARAAHRDLEDADYILSTATMAEDGLFTDWYESWIGRLAGYRGCAELLRATVEAPTTVEGDFHSYGCVERPSRDCDRLVVFRSLQRLPGVATSPARRQPSGSASRLDVSQSGPARQLLGQLQAAPEYKRFEMRCC
jgi:hypothetical protein